MPQSTQSQQQDYLPHQRVILKQSDSRMRQSQERPSAAGDGMPKFGFGNSDPYALSEHGHGAMLNTEAQIRRAQKAHGVFNQKRFTMPNQN